MAILRNLTRNTIRVFDETGGLRFELPTEVPEATATEATQTEDILVDDETGEDVEVVRHIFADPRNVPPEEEGVVYVVGYAVLQALAEEGIDRPDLVAPDTGRASVVREGGRIIGVKRFRII